MAGKSIDDAFAVIIKDCQTIAAEAVKNAAKKAQDDIVIKANNYLLKYYFNYTPRRYDRSRYLYKSIVPVFEDRSNAQKISITVGVEYDSSKLKGHYKSHSRWHQSGDAWHSVTDYSKFSPNNGLPEPEWIMNNALEGIHPITKWSVSKQSYVYTPKQDSESTSILMEDFFDTQLPNHINQYVQNELFDAITSRL